MRQKKSLKRSMTQNAENKLNKLFKAKSDVLMDGGKKEYITFGKGWPL
jgi:hypothetical protein